MVKIVVVTVHTKYISQLHMVKLSEALLLGRSIHWTWFYCWILNVFKRLNTDPQHNKDKDGITDRTRIRIRNLSATTPNQDPYTIDEKT